MYSKLSTAAFAVAVLSPAVSALGNAIIKNQCSQDVYLWTTTNVPGQMRTIPAGQSYSEGYLLNPDGGGVSMKISTTTSNTGAITQLEYTVDGMLWYDISNINGYPFMGSGLTLVPSEPSCRSVVCEAGVELCSAAYNQPDENWATAACSTDADTTLVLCSGQQGSEPVASASEVAQQTAAPVHQNLQPAAASTTAPVATPAVQVAAVTTAEPAVATQANGAVATTFVTHVVTVVAGAGGAPQVTAAPAPATEDASDWSFFHHPASLGADWGFVPARRDMHKRAVHRHHFHRHAAGSN